MTQIIGVMLIKNEDLHIEWAISNVLDFCDHIMVLDNYSTDRTWEIIERLAGKSDKIAIQKWQNAKDSQKVITRYYGTDTWVFGVDGDEVFDPAGLVVMRKRLFSGEFDHVWNVRGNFLNCVSVNFDAQTADGYLAPPAREGVKLYNFKLVKEWKNEERQRLHGHPIFSRPPGVQKLFLGNTLSWEEAQLRSLHLCFLKRSSNDIKPKTLIARLKHQLFHDTAKNPYGCRQGVGSSIEYKMKNYAVGDIVTRDISGFIAKK